MKIQNWNVLNNSNNFSKNTVKYKENSFVVPKFKTLGLEVLSLYGKANIKFRGQIPLQDRQECLDGFKARLESEKDSKGGFVFDSYCIDDIMSFLNIDNILFAEKLCFGKDEQGNDFFPCKDMIADVLFSCKNGGT